MNITPKAWLIVLGALLLLAGLAWLALRRFELAQVYHPGREIYPDPVLAPLKLKEVAIPLSANVMLSAWFFESSSQEPGKRRVILYCHGNGGNISHRGETYVALLECGATILAFDYQGYGRSPGSPNEENTYSDAQAAYKWLTQQGYSAEQIVVYGESLGGGVASELARREKVGGLILQSTFTSTVDLGEELFGWLPVRRLAHIHYDTRSRLPQLHVPLLILHSRSDSLIPFSHAEKNFAVANEPKELCELSGDHNDPIRADRQRFVDGVSRFLKRLPPIR
ncbi:MAG TPA: alpha/beta hydrolase [Roseimicrobium sp.]|nr:alpha/beta hydrolase [Roseimicrobium sp.]